MTPRQSATCVRPGCGKPCPGFSKRFCSDGCAKQVRAARRRNTPVGQPKACVVCEKAFSPRGSTNTCSEACRSVRDREVRSKRARAYHQNVRKPGLVRNWSTYATPEQKARLAARAHARREANPEHARAINRASRERHAESANARTEAWKRANPEAVRRHRQADYERHKPRFHFNALKRKLQKKANGSAPRLLADLLELYRTRGGRCAYCGGGVDGKRGLHLDHVIPLALGGPDTLENLVGACAKCNRAKWANDPVEWMRGAGFDGRFAARFPDAWARLLVWKTSSVREPFDPPRHLSLEHAADFFGLSIGTLRRRLRDGELQANRVGNGPNAKIMFALSYVERKAGRKGTWDRKSRRWVAA